MFICGLAGVEAAGGGCIGADSKSALVIASMINFRNSLRMTV